MSSQKETSNILCGENMKYKTLTLDYTEEKKQKNKTLKGEETSKKHTKANINSLNNIIETTERGL